jgi:tRNA pseudouridine13 synthase
MHDTRGDFQSPLPLLTADLPGIGGRLRAAVEDFQVQEIPLYEPRGEGTHSYLWVEKRGLPTMELVHLLARALGRNPRDFGVAGLKDARAVTCQWISIEHVDSARLASLEGDGFRVLKVARHGNKLRIGHLKGNQFRILVRDPCPGAEPRARAILDRLTAVGVPNLFGRQRFGLRGDTHLIGGAILRRDWTLMCDLLLGGPRETDPPAGRYFRGLYEGGQFREARAALPPGHREHAAVLEALMRTGGDFARAAGALPRNMKRFFVSAWQSALFNEVLARRAPELGRLMVGDLAWLHDRGAVFAVQDAAAEQQRADRLEISPTGPLFGYRMTQPTGLPGEMEERVLAATGMTLDDFRRGGEDSVKGGRRPLRAPLAGALVEPAPEGLWVSFRLPPGCYATTVLDELMKTGAKGGIAAGEAGLND